MAVILNEISIKNKIGKALQQKRYQQFAFNAAKTRAISAKQELLENFDNHPVTQEIKNGNEANSQFLPFGNLASFIGFDEQSNPTDELKDFISKRINIINSPNFRNNLQKNRVYYEFPVQYPTLQEIYDATPMPSEKINKSWVQVIQDGYGTFSHYIFSLLAFRKLDASRSKTAIQSEHKITGVKDRVLGNINYINELMQKFKDKFSRK